MILLTRYENKRQMAGCGFAKSLHLMQAVRGTAIHRSFLSSNLKKFYPANVIKHIVLLYFVTSLTRLCTIS